jgi:Holliday junction resolvase-like predicted endonuclease
MAIEEIKLNVEGLDLIVTDAECVCSVEVEHLEKDWFQDSRFLIQIKIETDLDQKEVYSKLSTISEYLAEYTDIEDPDILLGIIQYDYEHQDSELTSLFFDYDVKMSKSDIFNVYQELQRQFNGDIIKVPEGDNLEIYEGNLKDFLESCNELEGFKRFNDEEEVDFTF